MTSGAINIDFRSVPARRGGGAAERTVPCSVVLGRAALAPLGTVPHYLPTRGVRPGKRLSASGRGFRKVIQVGS